MTRMVSCSSQIHALGRDWDVDDGSRLCSPHPDALEPDFHPDIHCPDFGA
jgi:hypothetical protein